MRIKLYKLGFLERALATSMTNEKLIWDNEVFVYRKSKYKERVNKIIKQSDASIAFRRKVVGLDQQSIYSPFGEFYDVEMEANALVRFVFDIFA